MLWISMSSKSMIDDTMKFSKQVNGCQGMDF